MQLAIYVYPLRVVYRVRDGGPYELAMSLSFGRKVRICGEDK